MAQFKLGALASALGNTGGNSTPATYDSADPFQMARMYSGTGEFAPQPAPQPAQPGPASVDALATAAVARQALPRQVAPSLPSEGYAGQIATGIKQAAEKYNLPSEAEAYLHTIADIESGYGQNLTGQAIGSEVSGDMAHAGDRAQGPFQFMTSTAKDYGLQDRNDPIASADAAARHLVHAYKITGTWRDAAIGHHSGAGWQTKGLGPNGRDYAKKLQERVGKYANGRTAAPSGAPQEPTAVTPGASMPVPRQDPRQAPQVRQAPPQPQSLDEQLAALGVEPMSGWEKFSNPKGIGRGRTLTEKVAALQALKGLQPQGAEPMTEYQREKLAFDREMANRGPSVTPMTENQKARLEFDKEKAAMDFDWKREVEGRKAALEDTKLTASQKDQLAEAESSLAAFDQLEAKVTSATEVGILGAGITQGSGIANFGRDIASLFGGKVDERSTQTTVIAAFNEITAQMTKSLSGALSEKELDFIKAASPDTDWEPAAIQEWIDDRRKLATLAVKRLRGEAPMPGEAGFADLFDSPASAPGASSSIQPAPQVPHSGEYAVRAGDDGADGRSLYERLEPAPPALSVRRRLQAQPASAGPAAKGGTPSAMDYAFGP